METSQNIWIIIIIIVILLSVIVYEFDHIKQETVTLENWIEIHNHLHEDMNKLILIEK